MKYKIFPIICIILFLSACISTNTSKEVYKESWTSINYLRENIKNSGDIEKSLSFKQYDNSKDKTILYGYGFNIRGEVTETEPYGMLNNFEEVNNKFDELNKLFRNLSYEKLNDFSTHPESIIEYKEALYQKNDTYCSVIIFIGNDPIAYIFCGVIDKEATSNEILMNKTFSTLFDDPGIVNINVHTLDKDFASGSYRWIVGGQSWIAKYIDGKWEKIFEGQDTVSCAIIDKYKVPEDFYYDCVEEETDSQRILRFNYSKPYIESTVEKTMKKSVPDFTK